ncbi:MAG TPA: hypothetical protein VLL52_10830 [Anaerolineae bacterium]|nr:hypothetical protein [Anaerolineae bacterium]
MLVVLSDLHFVDGTSGNHNLPVDAFRDVFLENVAELARGNQATEVTLLLLGDIPDLIRSSHWLDAKPQDRPWGANGLADVENYRSFRKENSPTITERICQRILGVLPEDGDRSKVPFDSILGRNWDTFAFFRNFEEELRAQLYPDMQDIKAQLIYVPGNHDRLINLYPSLRDEFKKMLGLTVTADVVLGDVDDEWWYRYDFLSEYYGVYARHGHQYDPWNYGAGPMNSAERKDHLQPCIGDVVAAEFAVRLPWEARRMGLSEDLVHKLQDMDNVRPLSRLMEWFYSNMHTHVQAAETREALDNVFDKVIRNLVSLDFVQNWDTPHTKVDDVVRGITSSVGRWAVDKLVDLTDVSSLVGEGLLNLVAPLLGPPATQENDRFIQAAYREEIWRANKKVRFVLYGHTHNPMIVPLDGEEEESVLYFNTGTWRERIYRTVKLDKEANFVKLKQMSYYIFYGADEDVGKKPGTVSFDMWTGNKLKHYVTE